ncbi:uncharacterized protein F5Z01DRAFT_48983 [Emericellopsis atlantica]|uniref:F-box domain-containing protein n=1 Tax=Emericellopsis atlantica TaxID=2614577 RepID=A0A9P8CQH9_9HYPO|nr:uncharacterized protein F5Z01DRAFT_48983 [Emericellopsis atlantica]KAG9255327.1 hypothetical protein F5Z01DRAFT_48983 [Emericellopsis atlantica]
MRFDDTIHFDSLAEGVCCPLRSLFWAKRHVPLLSRTRAVSATGSSLEEPRALESLADLSEEIWLMIMNYKSLAQLPDDILVLIMKQLSPDSLWALRQTSSIFFRIFKSEDFCRFHGEPGCHDRHWPFSLRSLTPDERETVRKYIRPSNAARKGTMAMERCGACAEVHKRGEHDRRLVRLRRLYFCHACKENHAGVFFSAQSLREYKRGADIMCIGRIGWSTLWSQSSTPPITWETLDKVMSQEGYDDTTLGTWDFPCATSPVEDDQKKRNLCKVPILNREPAYEHEHVTLVFGWDLPLFEIDASETPSLGAIREFAANLVNNGVLRGLQCCQHMVDRGVLQDFAMSGICGYFATLDNDIFHGVSYSRKDLTCLCAGERVQDCEECGGQYGWRLLSGRVWLSYRYVWNIRRATSPGWLGLVDDIPALVHDDDSKYLLWCDQPGCLTGQGRRWMELVKEVTWLQCFRFEATRMMVDETERMAGDMEDMLTKRNEGGPDRRYQCPPQLPEAYLSKEELRRRADKVLEEIRSAREGGPRT